MKTPDGRGRGEGSLGPEQQAGTHRLAMEASKGGKLLALALLLLPCHHCRKTKRLLPHLLQLRAVPWVSSGVKSGQHRSPAYRTRQMRWELILDILLPTFSLQTSKAGEL